MGRGALGRLTSIFDIQWCSQNLPIAIGFGLSYYMAWESAIEQKAWLQALYSFPLAASQANQFG